MRLKKWGNILLQSINLLKSKNPLLLSAATAFFTLFSMAPVVIILINILSIYFKQEEISSELYELLSTEFGDETAAQIQYIVGSFRDQASSNWITVGGSIFLVFVATTLFHVIQEALHSLWNIRLKKSAKIRHNLKERSKAFGLIVIGGLLFVASLLADAAVGVLRSYLDSLVPSIDSLVIRLISIILSLVVVTLWFSIIFKFLPYAKVTKTAAFTGGLFTAFLFNIGKYLLGRFLITDDLGDFFGASASIVLLLLFIFYSSFIVYFGAAFTKVFSEETGRHIRPKKNAELFQVSVLNE